GRTRSEPARPTGPRPPPRSKRADRPATGTRPTPRRASRRSEKPRARGPAPGAPRSRRRTPERSLRTVLVVRSGPPPTARRPLPLMGEVAARRRRDRIEAQEAGAGMMLEEGGDGARPQIGAGIDAWGPKWFEPSQEIRADASLRSRVRLPEQRVAGQLHRHQQ